MPFLTLQHVTARNVNGDSINHSPGTVLSDWELEPYARDKILEGSDWYRARYEPLTENEAHSYRIKATQNEPPHVLSEGGANIIVPAPFDDYVGLHPSEIIARLKEAPLTTTHAARRYEVGGMRREMITGFVHPSERPPFYGYDEMDLRQILDKLELLGENQIGEAKIYEAAHLNRPAVVEFEKEPVAAAAA